MAMKRTTKHWLVGGTLGALGLFLGYEILHRRHEAPKAHGHGKHKKHESHESHDENERGEYGHKKKHHHHKELEHGG